MYSLLSSLKPDEDSNAAEESQSDDEDAAKIVGRKLSMNRYNVVGLNFEQYNDVKPT